jgi:hypothetical protein
MNKGIYILLVWLLLLPACTHKESISFVSNAKSDGNGYVPDAKTAAKIAEAVSLAIYGDKIYEQQPFNISLVKDSVWVINGTFNGSSLSVGGVVNIKIQKKDGKILYVMHGK